MTAKYQQIALNDIFSDFQSKLIDNYPLSLFFFQNTLISMNLFHPSSIRPSGFSKVPDTSLLSRFKHNFDAYIELMFQRMVDHTEPICQLIHVSLSQTSIVIPLSIHSTTQVETLFRCSLYPATFPFNPLHHTGGDHRLESQQKRDCGLSIHSTTQVETAISYNIIQDFLLISNKLTIISYIYHQFLLHILSITIPFCIFFWCESPWNFMFA